MSIADVNQDSSVQDHGGLMAWHLDGPVAIVTDLHYAIQHLPDQRQMFVTYHADPGSPSEESLRLLASLAS